MAEEQVETGELLQGQSEQPPDTGAEVIEESPTSEVEDISGEEPGEKKEETPWFKKRIGEITRQRREAEREADYWRGQAEALKKEPQSKPVEEAKPVDPIVGLGPEPRETDFEDYDKFLDQRRRWDRDVAKFEALAELQARQAQEKEREQRETLAKQIQSWSSKGKEVFDDFAEVALKPPGRGGPPYTDFMREAVLASDDSHRIAYYLGQHPERAQELCEMSPAKAIFEIAKLENKLAQAKPKTVSNAPAPIKPLESVSASTVDLYDPNLSMEDFAKRWNQERRKK
jgi:hypothetical protein